MQMKTNHKDILLIYIIFGIQRDEDRQIKSYIEEIEDILWHLDEDKSVSYRLTVAANLVSDKCIQALVSHFGQKIVVYDFEKRATCQIVCNSVVINSTKDFNEEYEGYFYISSGLTWERIPDWRLFSRIKEKLYSQEHGILQMQVDSDNGYHFLGKGTLGWFNEIDFLEDYSIPLGNHANFHAGVFHRKMKEYYGFPVTDVHGKCGMESVLSYTCAALGMRYTLMGNTCIGHSRSSDAFGAINVDLKIHGDIPCHTQMFGRDKLAIQNDEIAIETGIGYYPGPLANNEIDWNGVILEHNNEMYDEHGLAIHEKNKEVAKKYFFSNSKEIDYHKLESKKHTLGESSNV